MMRTGSWLFSTLAHDTLGIIPLAAVVVTTLRMSAKNSVRELIDYTTAQMLGSSLPYITVLAVYWYECAPADESEGHTILLKVI